MAWSIGRTLVECLRPLGRRPAGNPAELAPRTIALTNLPGTSDAQGQVLRNTRQPLGEAATTSSFVSWLRSPVR